MKFTNVKQLIIKFMGGGLINFPTRFLRWVKINGDTDDSDDGGGDSGGTGLTGNLLDDWTNAITQGEYTKYEDIPLADKNGLIEGWRRASTSHIIDYRYFPKIQSTIYSEDNKQYDIIKDGTFKTSAE